VHTDAVAERMRILWGAAALDAADRTAIAEALRFAAQLHGTREQGGFHSAEDSPPPVPRNRAQVGAHLRRPAMIAPAEIEAAAVALQAATPALTEKELATGITRMLGLEASAASALAVRVAALVGAGRVKLSAP